MSQALALGPVALDQALASLRRVEPSARAFYAYDLDALGARARRFRAAFSALDPLVAYALKANALPALLETLAVAGLGADAASLGELMRAAASGFDRSRRILNGNGKTPDELEWAAREGVHSLNADHLGELDVLERAAAALERSVKVALRVNPGIATRGHPYVATGDEEAKFGVAAADALEVWAARARWPHLELEGVHVHVGSQLLDPEPLERAASFALELADEAERRQAPLSFVNLGGGFGIDHQDPGREFPLERFAGDLTTRFRGRRLELVLEPGRWLVAPVGVLVSEVLWVKERDGRRFVVLAAGMNDFLRPALYRARHRIVPVTPRAGALTNATVVGPVCESADTFAEDVSLPPIEPRDLLAILDTGAYGACMASHYNGRPRLAELVVRQGRLLRASAGAEFPPLLPEPAPLD
jgi:diaminopimelate decarboxylase